MSKKNLPTEPLLNYLVFVPTTCLTVLRVKAVSPEDAIDRLSKQNHREWDFWDEECTEFEGDPDKWDAELEGL